MASVGYQVVVARLMENGVEDLAIKADFNEQYGTLMNIIRTAYTANMITDIKSLDLRTMFRPKVILLVTDEITKHEHVNYRSKLAKFVETGGTLILCCWFVSKSTAWGIEGILWEFRECEWTVAEGLEAFVRTDLVLNKATAMKQKFGDHAFNFLKDTYSMQAVNLKGVAIHDQIYRPGWQMVHPAVEALDEFAAATPSAYHKHGRGYLGYIGDIKLEDGTKELIVAMLEASISPLNQSNKSQPLIPNKPSPKPQGRLPPPGLAAPPRSKKSSPSTRPSNSAQGQETMGFKTTATVGRGSSSVAVTGARPSTQVVSPNGRPSPPSSLPATSTSTKMLVMQNGSPIVTSMNAIAEKSLAICDRKTMPQAPRSSGSNTDTVVHGGGHPMRSIHNLAAHTAMRPDIHMSDNSDRTEAIFSKRQSSPMLGMTSHLETSKNPIIAIGAVHGGPHEIVSRFETDSINVNAKYNSSQAVADVRSPQKANQFPITLPSLKPVARNDITALHQFKEADSVFSAGEDSYGGGLTISSVHTDLSGPPFCNSHSENAQLENTWDAEASERSDCNSSEIPVYDENSKTKGEVSASKPDDHTYVLDQASNSEYVRHTASLPTHQDKYDEDDLYDASITASETKIVKAKAEIHAHQALVTLNNSTVDSKPNPQTKNAVKTSFANNVRISEPKLNKHPQMPILAPCNPGCAVCTILLPASKCTGCRRVQYCSTACQKADWEEHKAVCGPQPSIKKSEERVNGRIQELMDDSQSEDFDYGNDGVDGEEDFEV